VESVPLITASILSKKIAAGLDALVMDVKVGSGAFMKTPERARKLAESIIATAAMADLKTHVLITDMNEVLGRTAGNALEIGEAVCYLRDERREPRLDAVVLGLCAEMLVVSGIEPDRAAATERCDEAVTSGRALEIFGEMVAALGGPSDFIENSSKYLAAAPVIRPVHATGFLTQVNTRGVGNAIIELGGGRHRVGEVLDLSVGFSDIASIGTLLDENTPLAVVHAASDADAAQAEAMFREACVITVDAPETAPVISEIRTGKT
jgi:thymidine phosphorylase